MSKQIEFKLQSSNNLEEHREHSKPINQRPGVWSFTKHWADQYNQELKIHTAQMKHLNKILIDETNFPASEVDKYESSLVKEGEYLKERRAILRNNYGELIIDIKNSHALGDIKDILDDIKVESIKRLKRTI